MKLKPLTPEEKKIIEEKDTEVPFTGKYENFYGKGIYICKRCGTPLYRSEDKFDAKCGWPSFDDEITGAVKKILDSDGIRTEIICARCGAHLGHVFSGERHTPKNIRHCVNSVSLEFVAQNEIKNKKETAYFAGGCFWCTEAVFKNLKGVLSVAPGYSGGEIENPTYEQVSGGKSGHAETIKIEYNPYVISYEALLKIFFDTHDPTAVNRQGDDIGPQYRSAIFYVSGDQKEIAENFIKALEENKIYSQPIATEIKPLEKFYEAEEYHKNYYEKHRDAPYCQIVISPKLAKLKEEYKNFLK